MALAVLRDRQPSVRKVRRRTVANMLSMGKSSYYVSSARRGSRRISTRRPGPWPGRPWLYRTSARRFPGRSRRRSRRPSWIRPSDVLQAPHGFLLQTVGQFVQDVARLVHPAVCSSASQAMTRCTMSSSTTKTVGSLSEGCPLLMMCFPRPPKG